MGLPKEIVCGKGAASFNTIFLLDPSPIVTVSTICESDCEVLPAA